MHTAKKTEESFGERVRRLREARGISIEDLSRDTGYPEDFLKDIEEDKVAPPVAVVLQLNRILNVDMDQVQGTRGKQAAKKRTTSHRMVKHKADPLSRGLMHLQGRIDS